jgi:hypothetical protein
MKALRALCAAGIALALANAGGVALARGGGHGGGHHSGAHASGSHSYTGGHTGSHTGGRATDFGAGSHSGSSYQGGSYSFHRGTSLGVERDAKGRIARSAKAKDSFKRSHPCPSTGKAYGACPGYVIDHVHALKRGGADAPSKMQWQTKAAARAKDRIE